MFYVFLKLHLKMNSEKLPLKVLSVLLTVLQVLLPCWQVFKPTNSPSCKCSLECVKFRNYAFLNRTCHTKQNLARYLFCS